LLREIKTIFKYPKSTKTNIFMERVNGTVQSEYLDSYYEETNNR